MLARTATWTVLTFKDRAGGKTVAGWVDARRVAGWADAATARSVATQQQPSPWRVGMYGTAMLAAGIMPTIEMTEGLVAEQGTPAQTLPGWEVAS